MDEGWTTVYVYPWDGMSWPVRADLLILGLLFAYTIAVAIQIARRYNPTSSGIGTDRATQARLAVELKILARHLDAIATVAPYLGLLGTCLGILNALTAAVMQRLSGVGALVWNIDESFVASAVGVVVAIAATFGKHYAHTRLDLLGYEPPHRKHPPMQRFTLPSFGIIAAYVLIIVFRSWTFVAPSSPFQKGHEVGIAPVLCGSLDRTIVVRISRDRRYFLNVEEMQDWRTLENRLSEIYRMREDRVLYLLADEGVDYQTVADAIGAVDSSNITVRLMTPGAMNGRCPVPGMVNAVAPRL